MSLLMFFLVLQLLLVLYFRRLHRQRAAMLVRGWRDNGRQWAIYGEAERSRWCHECADWWDQDWWASMLTPLPGKRPTTKI